MIGWIGLNRDRTNNTQGDHSRLVDWQLHTSYFKFQEPMIISFLSRWYLIATLKVASTPLNTKSPIDLMPWSYSGPMNASIWIWNQQLAQIDVEFHHSISFDLWPIPYSLWRSKFEYYSFDCIIGGQDDVFCQFLWRVKHVLHLGDDYYHANRGVLPERLLQLKRSLADGGVYYEWRPPGPALVFPESCRLSNITMLAGSLPLLRVKNSFSGSSILSSSAYVSSNRAFLSCVHEWHE